MKKTFVVSCTLAGFLGGISDTIKAQDLAFVTTSVSQKVSATVGESHEKIASVREKLPQRWRLGSLEGDLGAEERNAAIIEEIWDGKFLVRHEMIGMITSDDIIATQDGLEEKEIEICFSGLAIAFQFVHPFLNALEEGGKYTIRVINGVVEFIKKEPESNIVFSPETELIQ